MTIQEMKEFLSELINDFDQAGDFSKGDKLFEIIQALGDDDDDN